MNSWDKYYYGICQAVASNSKCRSRHVGAILVRDKSIISTGYNGPPAGVPHCETRYRNDNNLLEHIQLVGGKYRDQDRLKEAQEKKLCPRQYLEFKSGEGLEWCIAGHGEENAIINAAKEGIATKGTIMYMNCGIPCQWCLIKIINAKISEIVIVQETYYDKMSQYLVSRSGLKVRLYDLPNEILFGATGHK